MWKNESSVKRKTDVENYLCENAHVKINECEKNEK